jgi:hypothetical protein
MRYAALLLLLAAAARADSWAEFGTRTYVAPDKRHSLVAWHERSGGVGYELRAGGQVIAKGKAPQLPLEVHVLSGTPAAILFEQYGYVGRGDTLQRLGKDGLAWRMKVGEAALAGARKTMSATWWARTWWVDEPRGRVVLVARNGYLAEVDLETGKLSEPAREVVLHGVRLPWARQRALEVAVDWNVDGLRAAAEPLAADASLPAATRLRAALAVEKGGGPTVTEELWNAALESGKERDRRALFAFACRHVSDLDLVVTAALRRDVGYQAARGLQERGAVRELVGLVTHGDIDPKVRDYVGTLLGKLPADAVLRAIRRELRDAEPVAAGVLLRAAIATKRDLEEIVRDHETTLLETLDKQTGPVGWLADYFREHPTSEAVKPLLKALRKYRRNEALRKRIIAALRPCTGLDFGDDVDTWLKRAPRN